MAITDSPPSADAHEGASEPRPAPFGTANVFGTGDHKTLGRLWIGVSLVYGLVFLGLAAAWQADLLVDDSFLPADSVFRLFTLSRFGIVLLFVAPLLVGLATAIVPLQVGSSTVAFPRAAALAFWSWLLGGAMAIVAHFINGGVAGGDPEAVVLTLVSLAVVIGALLLGMICAATTVVTLRAPGMWLDRVPAFSWSILAAAGVWLLTLPVYVANLVLIVVDVAYGRPTKWGISTDQWQQLGWLFDQPQVFVLAIPALGIVADVIATFSRGRQPWRGLVLFGIGAFAALAIGSYAQPYFVTGVWTSWLFIGQSVLLVLPVLCLVACFASAFRSGRPKGATPVGLAIVAVLVVLLAAVAALPFGIEQLELASTPDSLAEAQPVREAVLGGPVYQWGVFYLAVGAALAGALAGLVYWGPKLTGRRLADGVGKLNTVVVLGGAVLAGLPLVLLGFGAKASALADASDMLIGASVAGVALLLLATLLAGFSMLGNARVADEQRDPDDAWECGQTLEWACPNPPPPGNFAAQPTVRSAEPLLDDEEGER